MTLPNFLIIGAPKSGTTSLYRYLNQHPQIYMSRLKEPHFFLYDRNCVPNCTDRVGLLRQREMVKRLSDYEKLFQGCGNAISIGESSIRYLYSQDACENIYRRIPKVKLIALLRNPVERAFSNFLRDKKRGTEPCHDFQSALADGKRRLEQGWFSGLHQHLGYYFHHLSKYYKIFEREQVTGLAL